MKVQEVDQLREGLKTKRRINTCNGRETKYFELEERIIMKSSVNYGSKEDVKRTLLEKVKTRLQEKETDEKVRKDRFHIVIFGIKENQAGNQKDKQTEDKKK